MNSSAIPFLNTGLSDIIELKGIEQTYDNGKTYVLKDLNFLVEDVPNQGQFVVILGTSGCGKSTVLRFISGLQTPSKGEILIHGKPRNDKTRIGMVFQQYSSFPWLTVLDNVALGLKYKGISRAEREAKALEILKLVGLEDHINKYAKYPTLSGGQLQRIAIARSLVVNPEILLMDEPFGALDAHNRMKMQELLAQLWLKLQLTCVFVTHDISEAVFLADEIWLMRSKPGCIVEKMKIDFPIDRPKSIKRTPRFTEYVAYIEDRLTQLGELQK